MGRIEKINFKSLFLIDRWSLACYLFLTVVGVISIYSTTVTKNFDALNLSFIETYYGKQIIIIGFTWFICFFVLNINTLNIQSIAVIVYIISIILLLLVLFYGKTVGGNKSWIDLGWVNIQPSELSKFGTMLFLSRYLSSFRDAKFWYKKWSILIILVPMILIILQPDFGSSLVFLSFLVVFYIEGMPNYVMSMGFILLIIAVLLFLVSKLIVVGLICFFGIVFWYLKKKIRLKLQILLVCVLISIAFVYSTDFVFKNILSQYHRDRVEVVLGIKKDLKGTGYNLNQSLIAIGSGGFLGKGFLEGTQTKFNFVPEQRTDFIFCTISEEFGFLGNMVVLGVFLFLILRLMIIANRQSSSFARIFIHCTVTVLFFHFFVNIAMTIGIVPIIGIPLPLISYGGSSFLSFSLMIFVCMSMDSKKIKNSSI